MNEDDMEEQRAWMEDNVLGPLAERMLELGVIDSDTRQWTIKWEDYDE